MKRVNPYTRLLNEIKEFCRKLRYPHSVVMWRYPKNTLDNEWSLADLYERVAAAKQLNYEVFLTADKEDGLIVRYRKKQPETPFDWR